MPVCEAFQWRQTFRACDECGHPYWLHSHEYTTAPDRGLRPQHRIITTEDAISVFLTHGHYAGGLSSTFDERPDLRPRYQIMQERQVSISKFYLTAAQLHKHRTQDGYHALPLTKRQKWSFGEFLDEARRRDLEGDWLERSYMVVCRTCGNKRCPRAGNSEYLCTGSNEPGQVGALNPLVRRT